PRPSSPTGSPSPRLTARSRLSGPVKRARSSWRSGPRDMRASVEQRLAAELDQFRRDGVYKRLNYLDAPQAPRSRMAGRGDVIILSSNNYLGLCTVPEVVQAGHEGLDRYGAGTASVRFICGTFTLHRE